MYMHVHAYAHISFYLLPFTSILIVSHTLLQNNVCCSHNPAASVPTTRATDVHQPCCCITPSAFTKLACS